MTKPRRNSWKRLVSWCTSLKPVGMESNFNSYLQFSAGQYYLINQIQAEQEEGESFLTWSDKENAQMALTFTILGLIQFNSNEKITDEALFKFLKQMGGNDPSESDPLVNHM